RLMSEMRTITDMPNLLAFHRKLASFLLFGSRVALLYADHDLFDGFWLWLASKQRFCLTLTSTISSCSPKPADDCSAIKLLFYCRPRPACVPARLRTPGDLSARIRSHPHGTGTSRAPWPVVPTAKNEKEAQDLLYSTGACRRTVA